MFDLGVLIGMDFKQGNEVAQAHGYRLRITNKNGNECIVTMDYWPHRINVAVDQDDVILSVRGDG